MTLNYKNTLLFLSCIAILSLISQGFQNPQAPISPVRPTLRVDSFLSKTNAALQKGDFATFNLFCDDAKKDAVQRQEKALDAAWNLRKAEQENRLNLLDNSRAIQYYQQSIKLLSGIDSSVWQLQEAHYGLALSLYRQGAQPELVDSLLKPLVNLNTKQTRQKDAAFLLGLNAIAQANAANRNAALKALTKVPNYRQDYELILQAFSNIENKQWRMAEALTQRIEKLLKNTPAQDEGKRSLAKLYRALAAQLRSEGKILLAAEFEQRCILTLSWGFAQDKDLAPCPAATQISPDPIAAEALLQKGMDMISLDSTTLAARMAFQVAMDLSTMLQSHIYTKTAKLRWLSFSKACYRQLNANVLAMYQLHGDENLLYEDLFTFSEKQKAVQLYELAYLLDSIPFADSLMLLEQQLATEAHFYQCYAAQCSALGDSALAVSAARAAKAATNQRESLLKSIAKTRKKALQIKYGAPIPNLKELKAAMEKDIQLLIFAETGNKTILLSLSPKGLKIQDFDADTLRNDIADFRKNIATKVDAKTLGTSGFSLYQKLLSTTAEGKGKRLIVFPTIDLISLPFGLLCNAKINADAHFKTLPYLFRSERISMQYSVADWIETLSERINPASYYLMAMSPSTDSLSGLEANYLLNRFSAQIIKGPAAKKSAFLEQAPRYGFIHLNNSADLAWPLALHFSKDSLSLSDIQNTKLNAALLVLSKLQGTSTEEGRWSLTYSFSKAGAGSLLASLWAEESEEYSQVFFTHFYEYLQQGLSKDEALRRAQLDYLDLVPDAGAAPRYWGQYLQIGDYRNVGISEPISYIWWYLLPILGLLGLGWWAMRGLRQRR